MTATRMVNGFLTLNFSMISYPFLFYTAARQEVRRNHGSTLRTLLIVPIIHEGIFLAIVLRLIFNKTFLKPP